MSGEKDVPEAIEPEESEPERKFSQEHYDRLMKGQEPWWKFRSGSEANPQSQPSGPRRPVRLSALDDGTTRRAVRWLEGTWSAAGVADHSWTMEEVVALLEALGVNDWTRLCIMRV